MEWTLRAERQGATDTGNNVRGALQTIGENAEHIKQGLTNLKPKTHTDQAVHDVPPATALFGLCTHAIRVSTRCSAQRMPSPCDTVRQIQITNYVFAGKMA